jgi:uncharacterized protein (DUF1778 family)
MPTSAPTREITINLRARKPQRDLIDRAAEAQGKSRSEFMLDAACQKAQEVLVDQTSFALDNRRYQRFLQLLDKPLAKNKGIAKLLASVSPWDK